MKRMVGTSTWILVLALAAVVDEAAAQSADRDHFKCYAARTADGEHTFDPLEVTLDDSLESKRTVVVNPRSFCVAAEKNDEGVPEPFGRLECYHIADASGQDRFPQQDVEVRDQFGDLTLHLKNSAQLCVPSSSSHHEPEAIDHVKCYFASIADGTPKFEPRKVRIEDAFESKRFRVGQPRLFCDAVEKNGEGVIDSEARWTCYHIEDASAHPGFAGADVPSRNQFGSEKLTLGDPYVLCVPSGLQPTPTPTATATSTATATATPTETATPTQTATPTETATPTQTATPTITPTATATGTATNTPTETPTSVPTDTPTITPTATLTPTDTPTATPTDTPTTVPTDTPTATPTATPTTVPTDTPTVAPPTATATATSTPAYGASLNPSPSNGLAFLLGSGAAALLFPGGRRKRRGV